MMATIGWAALSLVIGCAVWTIFKLWGPSW